MTRTVPSGTFSICITSATMPISYKSSGSGSSTATWRWAISRMCWLPAIASSSARTDFSRPTKSGKMTWGKWTLSRMGSSGRVVGRVGAASIAGFFSGTFLVRGVVVRGIRERYLAPSPQ